jgi:hypothetical protein
VPTGDKVNVKQRKKLHTNKIIFKIFFPEYISLKIIKRKIIAFLGGTFT